jgi:trans-aconitate 2-methyltransferase
MAWDPGQYEKFKAQRSKPFHDLVALIGDRKIERAIDLGCGTGELTRTLFDRLQPRELLAIDSSAEMLAGAAKHACPGLRFEQADIAAFRPAGKFDLVFSNAALQWLPAHETLFPAILGFVAPGGQVAVQMPHNHDHPSHRVAREVALRLFPEAVPEGGAVNGTLAVERYAELLFAHGFEEQVCRVEVYGHPMPSGEEVIEWTKGTLLTAYRALLGEARYAKFLEAYRAALMAEIGSGPYFYAFKRLLIRGRKTR